MGEREAERGKWYGIEALITRVAKKSDISEEAAAQAVDVVLTAVKQKLPPPMAARLVRVVAGEDSYDGAIERCRKTIVRRKNDMVAAGQESLKQANESVVRSWGSLKNLFKFR